MLRCWFERPDGDPSQWFAAQDDAVVGPALRLLQHHPEHPWTVAELARTAGVSRAGFALAADLIREPVSTLEGSLGRSATTRPSP